MSKNPPSTEPALASDESLCPICFSDITNRALANNCKHSFCFECLTRWSQRQNRCPKCRQVFNQILHNWQQGTGFQSVDVQAPEEDDDQSFEEMVLVIFQVELSSACLTMARHAHQQQLDYLRKKADDFRDDGEEKKRLLGLADGLARVLAEIDSIEVALAELRRMIHEEEDFDLGDVRSRMESVKQRIIAFRTAYRNLDLPEDVINFTENNETQLRLELPGHLMDDDDDEEDGDGEEMEVDNEQQESRQQVGAELDEPMSGSEEGHEEQDRETDESENENDENEDDANRPVEVIADPNLLRQVIDQFVEIWGEEHGKVPVEIELDPPDEEEDPEASDNESANENESQDALEALREEQENGTSLEQAAPSQQQNDERPDGAGPVRNQRTDNRDRPYNLRMRRSRDKRKE